VNPPQIRRKSRKGQSTFVATGSIVGPANPSETPHFRMQYPYFVPPMFVLFCLNGKPLACNIAAMQLSCNVANDNIPDQPNLRRVSSPAVQVRRGSPWRCSPLIRRAVFWKRTSLEGLDEQGGTQRHLCLSASSAQSEKHPCPSTRLSTCRYMKDDRNCVVPEQSSPLGVCPPEPSCLLPLSRPYICCLHHCSLLS
jgi:hypothetical protein